LYNPDNVAFERSTATANIEAMWAACNLKFLPAALQVAIYTDFVAGRFAGWFSD
jgi:hypothetical protein